MQPFEALICLTKNFPASTQLMDVSLRIRFLMEELIASEMAGMKLNSKDKELHFKFSLKVNELELAKNPFFQIAKEKKR